MNSGVRDPGYRHGRLPATGVLLVNLGTPDAPTAAAVRRYLAEFLWDRRVVELARPLWWLILHGVILRVRPARVARNYAAVWTDDGSPLLSISRRQAALLQERLARRCPGPVKVALGMRYGNPSIPAALEELRAAGVERLLVLPLYPQYSATTTATTVDRVAEVMRNWRWLPELRFITHYHDDPAYIEALAASLRAAWEQRAPGERLLFSFHGIPERYHRHGDPYPCQCRKSARLVAERLGLPDDAWSVAFQSRFGRDPWVKPYTDATLREWARAGVKRVDVVSPGFAADCLETLEELAVENRDLFLGAGGGEYSYIRALNDDPLHMDLLESLVLRHASGWPETAPAWDAATADAECDASRERALAAGAPD